LPKGFSVAGLVIGIVVTLCGIAVIVLSAVAGSRGY
jgi:hypothetical protein